MLRGNNRDLLFPPSPAAPQSKTSTEESETLVDGLKSDLLEQSHDYPAWGNSLRFSSLLVPLLFIDGAGMEQLPEGVGVGGSVCWGLVAHF